MQDLMRKMLSNGVTMSIRPVYGFNKKKTLYISFEKDADKIEFELDKRILLDSMIKPQEILDYKLCEFLDAIKVKEMEETKNED